MIRELKHIDFSQGKGVGVRQKQAGARKTAQLVDPEPQVIVGLVRDTGLIYRVRPERGGKENPTQ